MEWLNRVTAKNIGLRDTFRVTWERQDLLRLPRQIQKRHVQEINVNYRVENSQTLKCPNVFCSNNINFTIIAVSALTIKFLFLQLERA